jgi:hypothetical protein
MANTKLTKIRRTRRKFSFPLNMSSLDTDLNDSIEDGRYRYYPTELDNSSVDSQGSNVPQHPYYENNNTLEHCGSGLQEYVLSDHISSIDVQILEREMKTVLTDLEKLGILEDDYKSLAMTAGEEEKVDDNVTTTYTPLASLSEEMETDDRNDLGGTAERENDWEVISSTGSVWTVETFEEEKSYRDDVLDGSPYASAGLCAHFNGEPRIHTIPVEMMPPMFRKPQQPPKQLVNLEMLERADLWSSIRDSIRGIGGR